MIERLGRFLIPYLYAIARHRRERLYAQVAREARRTARR